MLKKAFKFGGSAGLILSGLFMASYLLLRGDEPNFEITEVIGYVSIVLSLTAVFFGIRSFRDNDLNGEIAFGKALQTGLLITLFVATIFAVFDTLYVTVLNPDFYSEYMAQEMKTMRDGGATAAELDSYEQQYSAFLSPFGFLLSAAVMFVTIFLIGFIVSMISSWVLRTAELDAVDAV